MNLASRTSSHWIAAKHFSDAFPSSLREMAFHKMISCKLENLHVGVLGGGDLGAVGEVDVSLLGKRPVDVFVVDVLDHRLEMDNFYIFNQYNFCWVF